MRLPHIRHIAILLGVAFSLGACRPEQPAQAIDASTLTPALDTPASTSTFIPEPTATASSTPDPGPVQIVAVGDVMMGRVVNRASLRENDFTWPFALTRDTLQGADLALGNLEAPLVQGCHVTSQGMHLCANPRAIEGPSWAGFDVLSLANNHAMDYDVAGFTDTTTALTNAGIAPVSAASPVLRTVKGLRIGVMAYMDVDRDLDIDAVRQQVAAEASQVDLLIGMIHWGYEYRPNAAPRQQELAHALIESGMRVIFGAHPHVIQPIEEYHGGLIFYSLGNFVFDQADEMDTRRGLMVRLTARRANGQVQVDYETIPILISGFGQPKPVDSVPIPTLEP